MACKFSALRTAGLVVLIWPSWLGAQGIYTCVDAQGRKLVSDRPIPECIDRVQKELGSSGVVRRQIVPTTHQGPKESALANRQAVELGNDKTLREQRQQRALLDRYTSEASHADERKRALLNIDQSLAQTQLQLTEHMAIGKDLLAQAAPFQANSQTVPRALKMRLDENRQSIALLQGVLDERNQERKRTNERFDEELALLRKLWAQGGVKP